MNGRLSLKLVDTMRDFSFQIKYFYGTSPDSLQSGRQGLVNATAFSISPIETDIIWNVPVLTNYKAKAMQDPEIQNILQDPVIILVSVIVYASKAEEFSQEESHLVMLYCCDRSRGGSIYTLYQIHFSYTFTVRGREAFIPPCSTKGAQRCRISSSLQPKYQKMDGADAETSL
ncbi:hypothetical protein FH972_010869 [Carpinus fangiana]|uniref:Uncharacterized protein n=1 Tax=Carpinus fangiana TaxID=176857 RepID=A0A660KPK2_9ROSI|nr:hypothetical protein FH972_010869 [Carpinus fangiana]